jgi:hypothetical protein
MKRLVSISVVALLALGTAVEAGAPMQQQQEEDDDDALTAKACASADVDFDHDTDKKQHPTPEPEPDKALIYVLRPTRYGHAIQTKLSVDGVWRGVNKGKNYFFLSLEPGEHYFCSKSENRSTVALTVEAGKVYYIQQKIRSGFLKARNKIEVLNEKDGQKALKDSHLSTWKEKEKTNR